MVALLSLFGPWHSMPGHQPQHTDFLLTPGELHTPCQVTCPECLLCLPLIAAVGLNFSGREKKDITFKKSNLEQYTHVFKMLK